MSNKDIEAFWERFLKKQGLDYSTKYNDAFTFGNNRDVSNKLCQLVLDKKKTATASLVKSYEASGEIPPKVGEYLIVVDYDNNPKCIIQTKAITIIPFNKMTYEICKRESEDDTLKTWKSGHLQFFSQDAKELGFVFDESMDVFFQDFEMVYHENY